MSLLVVNNLGKDFPPETILNNINLKLEWRQKLGLVGRNGAGKTTLLRILTGQMEAERGSVNYERGVRFGYLKQEDSVDPNRTVLQEAEIAFAHVMQMESRMREVEIEMGAAHGEELDRVMQEYGLLRDRFEAMGGYDNLRDIPGVLKKLGFGPNDIIKLCGKLSGGEKTRLAIARLLLSGPDILFLDEPTNHLDIEATEWLESFLKDFGGAMVLVSHDRYFLDRVVTSVAEVDNTKLTAYNGNFSAYWKQKEENRRRQLELYEREQSEIKRLTEFFEKWKNTPSKKNQAVMRMRWAERIKQHGLSQKLTSSAVERPESLGKSAKLGVKSAQLSGNEVIICDNVTKKYGTRTLFEDFTTLIQRGDRVGVVGPNGAGKSTLVKILLGRETATAGGARLGSSVTVGYFAQDTSDLDYEATVIENLMNVADMEPVAARTHLGRFLFSGDDVFRQVKNLSGGEKNKLVLAQLTYIQPNLLILDEPTNHLDMDSRQALGEMLQNYDGTLLLISHDRYLLEQVCTRVIEVADGVAAIFEGSYSEMRAAKAVGKFPPPHLLNGIEKNGKPASGEPQDARAAQLEALLGEKPSVLPPQVAGMNAHQLSKERRRAKEAAASVEKRVEDLEARLSDIEKRLSSPKPTDNVLALSQEHGGVQLALTEAMDAWEKAAEYAEALGG